MDKKIKVVWLCRFTSQETQEIFKPEKVLPDNGLWVPDAIKVIEGNPHFDVHVVFFHEYVKGIKRFDLRGVHYYCINNTTSFCGLRSPYFYAFDILSGFARNKRIVKKIIREINPDVIHLYGSENPYYSSTILPLLCSYPVILTVQGFAFKIQDNSIISKNRKKIERRILHQIPVSFYRTNKMKEDLLSFNPKMRLVWGTFNSVEIDRIETVGEKKYDIVFFARVCEEKGIKDLLDAVALIKKKKEDISLCVIGGGDSNGFYRSYAEKLGLSENVFWAGHQRTLDDVHKLAVCAKVSVLPTHNDMIPGTIIESLFLRIPVVANAVDSIPEINDKGEVIRLVEKGDIPQLAEAIFELVMNPDLREEYAEKGYKRAVEMFTFSNERLCNSLEEGYNVAIELFQNKKDR